MSFHDDPVFWQFLNRFNTLLRRRIFGKKNFMNRLADIIHSETFVICTSMIFAFMFRKELEVWWWGRKTMILILTTLSS
jgi:hypothetical protein